MRLCHLLYVSRSVQPVTPTDLQVLAQRGASHNRIVGITGLLLHQHGWFMQLLEGGLLPIGSLFDRIRHDPRHVEVEMLFVAPAAERLFPTTSLAVVDLDHHATDRGLLERMAQEVRRFPKGTPEAQAIAVSLLRPFASRPAAVTPRAA